MYLHTHTAHACPYDTQIKHTARTPSQTGSWTRETCSSERSRKMRRREEGESIQRGKRVGSLFTSSVSKEKKNPPPTQSGPVTLPLCSPVVCSVYKVALGFKPTPSQAHGRFPGEHTGRNITITHSFTVLELQTLLNKTGSIFPGMLHQVP